MVDKNLFLHDLSVVAIMKNEGPYLKEWLDYHLLAGVEHFYLYDNESPDNQAEVVKPYVEAGLVDYIPAPGQVMQYITCNDAIKRFKFQTRYMAFTTATNSSSRRQTKNFLKLSTKFYRATRTRQASALTGKCSARTVKTKPITLAASWKDLRAVPRKIFPPTVP